ncbi:MAG: hypothetical protein QW197_00615 [Candidatus Aenigmatarchaeota archaeon]
MVKYTIIFIGIVLFLILFLLGWFLSNYMGIEFLSSPTGYIFILLSTIPLVISGFLPYNWGKILREISYLFLFITLIIVEINLLKPYIKATDINLINCAAGGFVPTKQESGNIIYNALAYASCILSGYFPEEQKEIGWAIFLIFYLILPFAFTFAIIYGLINSAEIKSIFGNNDRISLVISFIISMYVTRTLLGGFILQFAGYGFAALISIFVSILLVTNLRKFIEQSYNVEAMAQQTRTLIERKIEVAREFAKSIEAILEEAMKLGNSDKTLGAAKSILDGIKDTQAYKNLTKEFQNVIDNYIDVAKLAVTPQEFLERIQQFKEFIKKLK